MTRLESGAIEPRIEPIDLAEVVGSALRARGQGAGAASRRGRPRRRPADAASSIPCCSSRCCSICSTTPRNTRRRAPTIRVAARARRTASCALAGARRRRRHSAGRSRAHLRQVLPRAGGRPPARRHRPRPRHLPRLRRGDGRHDHRRQPHATAAARSSPSTLPVPADAAAHARQPHDHGSSAARPGRRRRAGDPPLPAHQPDARRATRSIEAEDGEAALEAIAPQRAGRARARSRPARTSTGSR